MSPVNLVIGRWKWVRRGGEGVMLGEGGKRGKSMTAAARRLSPTRRAHLATTCRGHWPASPLTTCRPPLLSATRAPIASTTIRPKLLSSTLSSD